MRTLINNLSACLACICILTNGNAALGREAIVKETTRKLADYESFSVARIDHCGVNTHPDDKTFSIFADYSNSAHDQNLSELQFSSWNHATNGSTTEWIGLKQPATTYDIQLRSEPNTSCNNVNTLNMVLVKKIADWDRQHANGIEYHFDSARFSFDDLKTLVLDIRIDGKNTIIPVPRQLRTIYKNYVPLAAIDELDAGKANIGITLNGEQNLRASIIVEIDQVTLSDQWLRVTIPIKAMKFYQEVNYQRTPQSFTDLARVAVKGILIVAETHSGSVLRHNIANWSASVPETFKEIDLRLKKLEFQIKSSK